MPREYRLLGWELSLYSGKARAYLRYKNVPFREQAPNLLDMKRIKKHVRATVMPVLVTPDGDWLQDTSHIIDTLEPLFPAAPVVPETPRQKVAAYLLEAWGDEFWLPSAMHYRWHFGENFRAVFQPEGGRYLLPFAPHFLRNRAIGVAAKQMRSFLPGLGVTPQQVPVIEAWTEAQCDALEAHFSRHDYLLGSRPCLGDFGLIGPLYAHLGRDPAPRRILMQPRPALAAWIERMQHPPAPCGGDFLPEDALPETLQPLFDSIFAEFWPSLLATQEKIPAALSRLEPGRGLPRILGEITVPLKQGPLRVQSKPFSLWMAQRAYDAYHGLGASERSVVDAWLTDTGGGVFHELSIEPRLRRMTLHVVPDPESSVAQAG